MQEYKAKIKTVAQVASNIRYFDLELITPKEINFKAGQYILAKIPSETPLFRAYSIYSSPSQKNIIRLCITLVKGGKASEFFRTLKGGENIEFRGPLGHFFLEPALKYVFVATGSGVAPFHSMIIDLLEKDPKTNINLYFGVRHEENIFLQDELEELIKKYPNLKYTLTLSRPAPEWQGDKGYVTEHLKKLEDFKNKKYYLCGSTGMINDVSDLLKEKDVDSKNVYFERFY